MSRSFGRPPKLCIKQKNSLIIRNNGGDGILGTVNQPDSAAAVEVASKPWAFTQNEPLNVAEFIKEAQRRGFGLRTATLRELYRHGLLVPFVEVTRRPVGEPAQPEQPEYPRGGTRLLDLRAARDTGRLRDLPARPYQQRLSFEPTADVWPMTALWTGLLYSPYQMLLLPALESLLAKATFYKQGKVIIARLPKPTDPVFLDRVARLQKMAIALTALEARYLPTLDPEWIQLTNVPDVADWTAYRASFDPVQIQAWLAYPSRRMRGDAEWLLHRAHRLDPVGDDWGQLMRRAPAKSRKYLKNAALIALDDRIGAEILLRFYEDLVLRGQAEALPDFSGSLGWHPLVERLSFRRETLDENLIDLGISPHPRVVLALEGESELCHAPRIWRALEYPDAPELVRLLKLGTANQNLQKVVAMNVAPLVNEQIPGSNAWKLTRPSAHLIVAVDPDEPFDKPENVEKERAKLLKEIKDVLKDQGVERPNPEELDHLVEIQTWKAPCHEFAHFENDELADGIRAVHTTCNGLRRDELIASLAHSRDRGKDIKEVWSRWDYKVSKVKLAQALWPTLEQKIEQVKADSGAPAPPLVEVMSYAYHLAQRVRYHSFVLSEVPDEPAEPTDGPGNP